jgi:hypothetical protein
MNAHVLMLWSALALAGCKSDPSDHKASEPAVTVTASSGAVGKVMPAPPVDLATRFGGKPVPMLSGAKILGSGGSTLAYTTQVATPEDARAFYEKAFAVDGYTTKVAENEEGSRYVVRSITKKGETRASASIVEMHAGPDKGKTLVQLWLPESPARP